MALHAYDAASLNNLGLVRSVRAAGGVAVSLYVSGHPGGMASAPDGFALDVQRLGLAVIPNWERDPAQLVSDHATGLAAGREAVWDAGRVGFPLDGTIGLPFSVDVQVDPTNFHLVADAFTGIHDGIAGRVLPGCYGQGRLISYLRGRRLIAVKGWLSMSEGFDPTYWVGNPDVSVVQMHDAYGNWLSSNVNGCDINTILDYAGLHALYPGKPPITDLLEYIVTLDRSSPEYKALMNDVRANAAAGMSDAMKAVLPHILDAERFATAADVRAQRLEGAAAGLGATLDAVTKQVGTVAAGVAAIKTPQLSGTISGTISSGASPA